MQGCIAPFFNLRDMKRQTQFTNQATGSAFFTVYFRVLKRESLSSEDYDRLERILYAEIEKIDLEEAKKESV